MRILHLSDFHLNKTTRADWNDHVKDSLIQKIKELNTTERIDIIAFTGDLIDKGGKELGGADDAFKIFKEEIILPLLEAAGIGIDRFFITPGNHDIVRDLDTLRDELGSRQYFTKHQNISSFILEALSKNSYDGFQRIVPYKAFEKDLYQSVPNHSHSIFESSFKLDIHGAKIGISCINSSWRCYDDEDYGRILIGEKQLTQNYKFIKDCELKIALVHHQMDWLSQSEKKIVTGHIIKEYDIILSGHVHAANTNSVSGFTGTAFLDVAPSGLNDIYSVNRDYSNGFSVLDATKSGYKATHYRYRADNKTFVLNTDAGNEGQFDYFFPKPESASTASLVETALNNIREDHFPKMIQHFIGVKADVASPSVKNSFIFPPIDQGTHKAGDETQLNEISLQEIAKFPEHIMFFGTQESGKTSLLYRLVEEYVEEYELLQKIPVFFSLDEIGNREILTVIKEYLRCSSDQVRLLLKENKITLLIDNLNFKGYLNNQDELNRVQRFKNEYHLRIIATSEQDISGIIPTEHMERCKIAFNNYFIRGLRSKEIKQIMRQWMPNENDIKFDLQLEKLVQTFYSYSLPNSAMAVSLYLWSLENKERKPINQAVLMEIYIELILEKLNKENVYRDNFDFTNKLQLIAKIAHEMLIADKPNYTLPYASFVKVIEEYLTNLVGFTFDSKVIIKYLLDRKIFVTTQQNHVKFPYQCFFHFFVAKRMEFDRKFREYILQEEKYFNFPKEIDYYTGLRRSDIDTFKIIFERFKKHFGTADFVIDKVNLDDYFTVKVEGNTEAKEPIARNIEIAKIKENRPTEEKYEEMYDDQLSKITNAQEISNKNGTLSLDRLLLIMCNVLRNSEGIEDLELKKEAYNAIVKYNIVYAILYSQWVIRYVLEHQKLPPSIPAQISLLEIIENLPFHIQSSLHHHLGTNKLSQVILSKIELDKTGHSVTGSDLEAYFSVTLYADVLGHGFEKILKTFIKDVKNFSVQNYLLFKLKKYFYKRTRPGSDNEEMYLDLISELQIRAQKLPKRLKETLKKNLLDQKKKLTNLLTVGKN